MVVVKMMDLKRKWMIVNAIEKMDGKTIAKRMNFKIHTSNYYQPLT